ncbi:MAG: GIY-YIG nuclease family protein [Candidatus Gastranaerophilales bacterium]|nr:GIY-YIG nuclease family protein [Candidatus Gastranaerophilales bacterium]
MDNTLYCGIARNVLARFNEHKAGTGAKYTRSHKPEKLVYVDIFEDKSSASKEEYRIKKTLTRQEKLALIEQNQKRTDEILAQLSEN